MKFASSSALIDKLLRSVERDGERAHIVDEKQLLSFADYARLLGKCKFLLPLIYLDIRPSR